FLSAPCRRGVNDESGGCRRPRRWRACGISSVGAELQGESESRAIANARWRAGTMLDRGAKKNQTSGARRYRMHRLAIIIEEDRLAIPVAFPFRRHEQKRGHIAGLAFAA